MTTPTPSYFARTSSTTERMFFSTSSGASRSAMACHSAVIRSAIARDPGIPAPAGRSAEAGPAGPSRRQRRVPGGEHLLVPSPQRMTDEHVGSRDARLLDQGLQLRRLAAAVPGRRAGLAPPVSRAAVGDDARHQGDAVLQRSQLFQRVRKACVDDDGGGLLPLQMDLETMRSHADHPFGGRGARARLAQEPVRRRRGPPAFSRSSPFLPHRGHRAPGIRFPVPAAPRSAGGASFPSDRIAGAGRPRLTRFPALMPPRGRSGVRAA